jgi:hypothetical protein
LDSIDRIKRLASKIASLKASYSDAEFRDALRLLHGKHGDVKRRHPKREGAILPSRKGRSRRAIQEEHSLAVVRLRDSQPDKFQLLLQFDQLLRRGEILQSTEDLVRFAERISKSFVRKKSRRENVSSLLSLLAQFKLPEVHKWIDSACRLSAKDSPDSYRKLADFIMGSRLEG